MYFVLFFAGDIEEGIVGIDLLLQQHIAFVTHDDIQLSLDKAFTGPLPGAVSQFSVGFPKAKRLRECTH